MVYSFQIESMIRGYHQCKSIWESLSEDNALICEREISNAHDTHAVAIRKDINGEARTVGHSKKNLFALFYFYQTR